MAVLLNWVSSFMTALLPVDAAMCAHVIPSYDKFSTQEKKQNAANI